MSHAMTKEETQSLINEGKKLVLLLECEPVTRKLIEACKDTLVASLDLLTAADEAAGIFEDSAASLDAASGKKLLGCAKKLRDASAAMLGRG